MLKLLRHKRTAKIIFWALVILIMPAFVFWGTGSLGRSKDKMPTSVGEIANRKVPFDELFGSITSIRSQVILNYFNQPQVLDKFLTNKPFLAKVAWDRLIMLKEAEGQKIQVADEEVIKTIRNHPLFSRNGAFDEKIYAYVLRNNMGLDARNFEELVRENLKIQKLNDILTKDIKVSDDEVRKEYKKDIEKFKIAYIMIESKDFLKLAKIDDAAAKDYYEVHKNEFMSSDFEGVKASVVSYLSEKEAKGLAAKYAQEVHAKILDLIDKEKVSFEGAAGKLGLKVQTTEFFSKSDYIEGIGEASQLTDELVLLGPDQISAPIAVRKGAIVAKVLGSQGMDEAKFQKDKEEYSKKVLADTKNKFLETWLRGLELKAKLNIDLNEWEKYYR